MFSTKENIKPKISLSKLKENKRKRENLSSLSKNSLSEKREEDGGWWCSDAVVGHSVAASELFFKKFQIFFTSKRSSLSPLLGSTNSFTKNPHKRPRSTFLDFKIFRNQHSKENREKSCYLG